MRIALDDLTVNNLGTLKLLNQVNGNDFDEKWYEKANDNEDLVKLAYYSDVPVGAVKLTEVQSSNSKTPVSLFIESLVVLEAYSNFGIQEKLVDYAKEIAKKRFLHEISAPVKNTCLEKLDFSLLQDKERLQPYKSFGQDEVLVCSI